MANMDDLIAELEGVQQKITEHYDEHYKREMVRMTNTKVRYAKIHTYLRNATIEMTAQENHRKMRDML